MIARLQERGITLSRLQRAHPVIDRTVRVARRRMYLHRFFKDGPRRRGTGGRTFVIVNHCYDLDIDALCAANTPHTLWVLDPFALFTDVFDYFPPEQRDLNAVYGTGDMHASIARYKAEVVTHLARRLRDVTKLDALITPSDTFYYLRPLIEELRALGVPTFVQDKEGTIAPSAIMDDHSAVLTERYPPIADQYFFWSETHRDFWRRVGVDESRMHVLGQPRSDFFFHRERWPSKASLGLSEHKKLVVAFTYDADSYARSTDPNPERPWKQLRDQMHEAVRALARERSDVEVVVKAHPQQAELAEVTAEFAATPLPNLRLMTGAGSASHLIVHADVILGFQSTVMIEAMLTTKPVIYVGWGDKHDKYADGLIPIHRSGACLLPQRRDELDRVLREALDGQLRPSADELRARKAFTDRYFFDADGHASERVLRAAAAFVKNGSC
jgi:surface carbohydrate biosynthesis protein